MPNPLDGLIGLQNAIFSNSPNALRLAQQYIQAVPNPAKPAQTPAPVNQTPQSFANPSSIISLSSAAQALLNSSQGSTSLVAPNSSTNSPPLPGFEIGVDVVVRPNLTISLNFYFNSSDAPHGGTVIAAPNPNTSQNSSSSSDGRGGNHDSTSSSSSSSPAPRPGSGAEPGRSSSTPSGYSGGNSSGANHGGD